MLPGTVRSNFPSSAILRKQLGYVASKWILLTPATGQHLWPAKSEKDLQHNVDAEPSAHAHVLGRKRAECWYFLTFEKLNFEDFMSILVSPG